MSIYLQLTCFSTFSFISWKCFLPGTPKEKWNLLFWDQSFQMSFFSVSPSLLCFIVLVSLQAVNIFTQGFVVWSSFFSIKLFVWFIHISCSFITRWPSAMSFSILCVFIHFCQINWLFAEIIILSTIDKMTRRLCYCLSSRRSFKHNKTTADPGRAPFFYKSVESQPFFPQISTLQRSRCQTWRQTARRAVSLLVCSPNSWVLMENVPLSDSAASAATGLAR